MSVADESTPIRHIKKPDEIWHKGLSFKRAIGSDVIKSASVTVSAIDLSTGSSADVASYAGNKDGVVSVKLFGGQAGRKYQITVTVPTETTDVTPVDSEVYQKDIIMSVVSII